MNKLIDGEQHLKKDFIAIFLILLTSTIFAQNYFIKSEIKNGELKLYFDSDIDAVKYFVIPIEDGYTKFVYDIYGQFYQCKSLSHHSYKDVKSFRIAQNSKDRVEL